MNDQPGRRGWKIELSPRTRGLLLGAGLIAVAAATTGHFSVPPFAHTRVSTASMLFVDTTNVFDFGTRAPTRPPVREPVVNNTPSVYRRSGQVLQAENELRSRNLILPLSDFPVDQLHDSFNNLRAGGARRHGAIDMAAPKGTPVLSVDSGSVAKLHTSRDGGISVYATDPRGHFIYLYAHLDAYHPLLSEGQYLLPGDTLGYVGTTGNASPEQPHLHFSIRRASDLSRWSRGTPINPVRVWR